MTDLPDPTWRLLLSRGLPTFVLEGVLPVLVFYAVLRASSLPAAIVASSLAAGAAVCLQHRRGQDIALAAVTFVFIVVQSIVGLAAHSATVYLAQPVVLGALSSSAGCPRRAAELMQLGEPFRGALSGRYR